MPKTIPGVGTVMTATPLTVEIGAPLRTAHDLMIDHEIRHLPVVDGGSLVGIISDRDIAALENDAASNDLMDRLPIRDVCTLDTYAVGADTPLDEVLAEMAERRLGSVVIVEGGEIVGLFTATDACRCFAERLRSSEG